MTPPPTRDEKSVFLNVPFDKSYSRLFVALIAGITALGFKPRCVLEVGSDRNRLSRIYGLVAGCGASIHEMSRVSLYGGLRMPRFNMPFELGIAYALWEQGGHRFFVFEQKPYRLQASLSDLNGHDPYIHHRTQDGLLGCLLDCFDVAAVTAKQMRKLTRQLSHIISNLQREQKRDHPFYPNLFRQATEAGTELARLEGLTD